MQHFKHDNPIEICQWSVIGRERVEEGGRGRGEGGEREREGGEGGETEERGREERKRQREIMQSRVT